MKMRSLVILAAILLTVMVEMVLYKELAHPAAAPFQAVVRTRDGQPENVGLLARGATGTQKVDGIDVLPNLLPDSIPFLDPSAWASLLPANQTYTAVAFPFSITYRGSTRRDGAPGDTIVVTSADGSETRAAASVGTRISLNGEAYTVAEVGPWTGLLAGQGAGRPTVEVLLRSGDSPWSGALFLAEGEWRRFVDRVALLATWVDSEADARKAASREEPELAGARWGVRDAGDVNWFSTFVPGTGIELSHGGSATLLSYDADHPFPEGTKPAVHVAIVSGSETRDEWIPANGRSADGLVEFDFPSALPTVIRFYCWDFDTALVKAAADGKTFLSPVLHAGEAWNPDGAPWTVRFMTARRDAVVVRSGNGTLAGATLVGPDRWISVREGEVRQVGDSRVRFVRDEEVGPRERKVEVRDLKENVLVSGRVGGESGRTLRVGAWQIAAEPGPTVPGTAVFRVSGPYGSRWVSWLERAAFSVVGLLLLLLLGAAAGYFRRAASESGKSG